jgi:predicted porin
MKLKTLPLIISSVITVGTTSSALAGEVTVYGKANINYNSLELDGVPAVDTNGDRITTDEWDLNSAASRIGFKGSEDINENLKAIFKIEFEVAIDGDDSDDTLKRRNSYVGLQGNWGTIIAGNHDSALKVSQGKVDLFNDLRYADIANIFVGENRDNDTIMYTTPQFSGFAATVGISPGEPEDTDGKDDGPADSISATAFYQGDNLYAAIAIDDNVNKNDIVRATTTYKLGNLTLGAMAQKAEESNNGDGLGKVKGLVSVVDDAYGVSFNEMQGGMLSAAYKMDKWVFKGQYAMANYENDVGDTDVSLTTVGVDYKFTKRTKLYSYYTYSKMDQANDLGITDDVEATVIGTIGLEHKF